MKIGEKYTSALQSEGFDAIIIGSGLSGLATAIFLTRAGKRVLVVEQHFKVGGYTHTFKRGDYEWDVGLHYIGEVHRENSPLRRLFDDVTEGNLDWAPMGKIYDRMVFPDQSYDFVAGKENFREEMASCFPGEASGIDRYLDTVKQAVRSMRSFSINKAMPGPAATMAYPFMCSTFHKYSDRTTWEVLSQITSNKKLIGVLTGQWGDYGLPPSRSSFAMHAALANHYLDGASYPVGGSARIAQTIVPVIEKHGGKVVVSAPVDEILVHGKRAVGVRLANGDELRAPLVVSSAGVFNTFGKMLKTEKGPAAALAGKLTKVQRSFSYLCLYIGFKQTAQELGLDRTNLWVYPDYDHDRTLERYLAEPTTTDLPVCYLSFASAKDPSWEERHPGTATMEVIGVAPFGTYERWQATQWQKRGREYEAFKQEAADRLMEKVYETLPHLRGKVDYMEASTPLSTRHFAGYERGELYGLDHTPERMRQRWLRPRTAIGSLFLTGQDVLTCGIAGALWSGVVTASAILGKRVIEDVAQGRRK